MKYASLLLAALLLVAGCGGSQPATAPGSGADALTFSDDVQPLVAQKFAPLLTEDPELDTASWEGLVAGSARGEVLIPYDPDNSLLVEVAEHAAQAGQPNAPTEQEIARVRAWIEGGAKNDAGEVPFADAENLLYVPNQSAALVSIIDMETNQVIRTVDLQARGFSPNAKPHHVVVEPDGAHWYLSLIGANRVLKFDRANEIVGQIEFEVPGMMAVDAQSNRLYIGRSMSAVNPPKRIGIAQRSDLSLEQVDVFYPRPHALGVDPSGEQIYSASLAQNEMATINAATEEVSLTAMGGPINTLVQFAVAPQEPLMVAGGQLSGTFFFFDVSDPAAPRVADSLALGGQPWHPVFSPDGQRVYVGNKTANTVTVIDVPQRRVAATIEGRGLAQPHGSAVRPDGRYVYLSNNNKKGDYTPRYALSGNQNIGTVVVIDTQTNAIVKVIEVEENPAGLGTRPAS